MTSATGPQDRIIAHLNRDHADSLSLYLQHYLRVSSSIAQTVVLRAISLDAMILETMADGAVHRLPLDPPLDNWSQARVRTVEMDREARRRLGILEEEEDNDEDGHGRGEGEGGKGEENHNGRGTISASSSASSSDPLIRWRLPTLPIHIATYILILSVYVLIASRRAIVPGTTLYDLYLNPYFPFGGGAFFVWLLPRVFWFMFVIHLGEAIFFDRSRLQKHGISRGSGLWWAWTLDCLVVGGPSWLRFDILVREARGRARKDH